MFLRKLSSLLLLLPFVAADVQRLKLKKMPTTASEYSPDHEVMYLTQKYGGGQVPIFGAGGAGRKVLASPADSDLYWTQGQQDALKGGHGVPLTSTLFIASLHLLPLT